MRVALAQMDCSARSNAGNMARLLELIDRQARKEQPIDLLLAPELFNVGYTPATFAKRCEKRGGPTEKALLKLARRLGWSIVAGLGVSEKDRLYNEAVVLDPAGVAVARYRKMHLFAAVGLDESDYFTRGTEPIVAPIGLVGATAAPPLSAGLAICYDVRFPELFRRYFLAEVPLICIVSAFPEPRGDHWRALLPARAIENQCFVLGCNRVGTEDGLTFAGYSAIIDPWGRVVAEAGPNEEVLLQADIDLKEVKRARRRIRCRAHLSPELL